MEQVNHPAHYQGENGIEAIDAIRMGLGNDGILDFCHGNALKYLLRANKKGKYLEDLKKARWYLDYIIENVEQSNQNKNPDNNV